MSLLCLSQVCEYLSCIYSTCVVIYSALKSCRSKKQTVYIQCTCTCTCKMGIIIILRVHVHGVISVIIENLPYITVQIVNKTLKLTPLSRYMYMYIEVVLTLQSPLSGRNLALTMLDWWVV